MSNKVGGNNKSGNGGNGKNHNNNNSSRNWKQGGGGGEVDKKSSMGTINEFPILRPNKGDGIGSNFYDFKKLFIPYVFKNFQECGNTFDDDSSELYFPPEIDKPERIARKQVQKRTQQQNLLVFKYRGVELAREQQADGNFKFTSVADGTAVNVTRPRDLEEVMVDDNDPNFSDDPFADINDPHHLVRDLYREEVKSQAKLVREMKKNYLALYYVLWSNMSLESRSRVLQFVGFDETNRDVFELWQAIVKTHQNTGYDDVFNKFTARNHYRRLYQQKDESLDNFKFRFNNALERLKAADQALPSDEEQAIDFIEMLDNKNFAKFKTDLHNQVSSRIGQYPLSLAEAYQRAGQWREISYVSRDHGGDQMRIINPGDRAAFSANGVKANNNNDNNNKKSSGANNKHDSNGGKKKGGQQKDINCFNCGKVGHKARDCPDNKRNNNHGGGSNNNDDINRRINLVTTAISGAHNGDSSEEQVILEPYDLLLDNQSTVHIFNDARMLKNIRKSTPDEVVRIQGIGGDLLIDQVGEAGVFGKVYYHPKAMANVISFGALEDEHGVGSIVYDPSSKSFEVSLASGTKHFSFKRRGRLSICNVNNDKSAGLRREVVTLPVTVSENERLFSKREVEAAKKTRDLKRILGYPSDADLIQLLKSGIKNAPVDVNDVKRAAIIYGPDWSELKGKTVMNKPSVVKIDPIMRPLHQLQILHVDIMFVEGIPFLISVCQPLGLVMVDRIPDRKLNTLKKALSKHINHLHNHNFIVDTILSDGEGGISALQDELLANNIRYNPSGPGQHVPIVERKIRLIKERVRAHIHSLPFNLSQTLLVYLIYYVVSCINMLPNHNRMDEASPKELLTGRKINFETDLRAGFGDYVHATASNIVKNSMEARTQGCIALIPNGNLQGSMKFLRLDTNKIVTRDQWKALPMPDIVINRLNDLADLDNGKRSKKIRTNITDKIYFRRGGPLEEHEIDENGFGVNDSDCIPSDGIIPFIGEGRHLSSENYQGDEEAIATIGGELVESTNDVGRDIPNQALQEPQEVNLDDNGIPSEFNEPQLSEEGFDQGGTTEDETNGGDGISDGHENSIEDHDSNIQSGQTIIPTNDLQPMDSLRSDSRYNLRNRVNQPNRMNLITTVDEPVVVDDGTFPSHSHAKKHFGFRISVKKALAKFGRNAEDAIEKEFRQLLEKEVFEPVHPRAITKEEYKSIIRSHTFLKEKHHADGSFDKLKARFVAGGDMQDKSIYDDISSSTASSQTVFVTAGIAAHEGRVVKVGDVPGAYLNSPMKMRVLMLIDKVNVDILVKIDPKYDSFRRTDGCIVVLLKKALYGCVESANLWHEHLSNTLNANGFTINPYDDCIFNKVMDSGNQCTVCVYVDDLMVTSKLESDVDEVFEYLAKVYGPITISSGKKQSYLGMMFDFGIPGKVNISMSGYIDEILSYTKVRANDRAITPATAKLFDIDENSNQLNENDKFGFHSMVAKLLYMAKRVRPDILLAISFLTTRVSGPTEQDLNKLTRVIYYLNDTRELGLTLEVKDHIKVLAYIDASHGAHPNFKGHTGGLISLGHGAVHAKSSKQKLNSKSSTETELIGLSDYLSQVLWVRNFLRAQGYDELKPAVIFQDNKSTITMASKGKHIGESTRHIDIRYFFIKHYLESKEVNIEYLPTESMIADILTKPLQGSMFKTLRAKLLNL